MKRKKVILRSEMRKNNSSSKIKKSKPKKKIKPAPYYNNNGESILCSLFNNEPQENNNTVHDDSSDDNSDKNKMIVTSLKKKRNETKTFESSLVLCTTPVESKKSNHNKTLESKKKSRTSTNIEYKHNIGIIQLQLSEDGDDDFDDPLTTPYMNIRKDYLIDEEEKEEDNGILPKKLFSEKQSKTREEDDYFVERPRKRKRQLQDKSQEEDDDDNHSKKRRYQSYEEDNNHDEMPLDNYNEQSPPKIIHVTNDNQSINPQNNTNTPIEEYPLSSLLAEMKWKQTELTRLSQQRCGIVMRMEQLQVEINILRHKVDNCTTQENGGVPVMVGNTYFHDSITDRKLLHLDTINDTASEYESLAEGNNQYNMYQSHHMEQRHSSIRNEDEIVVNRNNRGPSKRNPNYPSHSRRHVFNKNDDESRYGTVEDSSDLGNFH